MASTDDELARLDAEGVPPDQLIWTWYFFSHFGSSHAERRAFRVALDAAGFTNVGADTEGSDDHYWHHWSQTIRLADRDTLREADRAAASIAVRTASATTNGRLLGMRSHSRTLAQRRFIRPERVFAYWGARTVAAVSAGCGRDRSGT